MEHAYYKMSRNVNNFRYISIFLIFFSTSRSSCISIILFRPRRSLVRYGFSRTSLIDGRQGSRLLFEDTSMFFNRQKRLLISNWEYVDEECVSNVYAKTSDCDDPCFQYEIIRAYDTRLLCSIKGIIKK